MSITIRTEQRPQEKFDIVPSGSHHGICYAIYDLGTHQPKNPEYKPSRRAAIHFELPFERYDYDLNGVKQNRARVLSETYPLSLGKKAKLLAVLNTWRGRPLTDEELKVFKLETLLGANGILSVLHNPGTGANVGKTFANINGIQALTKGTQKMKPENPLSYFSFEDQKPGRVEFPMDMPEWVKKKCMESPEYAALTSGKPTQQQAKAIDENKMANVSDGPDEDVPF